MASPLADNLRSPAAWARLLVPAIVGTALDLWTKAMAFSRMTMYSGVEPEEWPYVYKLIPGWLHFQLMRNEGAVFGMGAGGRWIFVVVSLAAVGFLVYLFATSGRQRLYQVLLGTLMAGVVGNLYDRIVHGRVRDMVHILPQWKIFPYIFNVADVLLCVGVGLMLVLMLMQRRAVKMKS
jgi:signal peptidase II